MRGIPCELEIAQKFRAIDLDNQARKGRMPGKKPLNCRKRTVAREERKWQIDSKFNWPEFGNEAVPVRHRLVDKEFGQSCVMRVSVVRFEIAGRDHTPMRVSDTDEPFGTAHGQRAGVYLGLIPEFKPAVMKRLCGVNRGARRRWQRHKVSKACLQLDLPKRRCEDGKHRQAELGSEVRQCQQRMRMTGPEQEHAATKALVGESLQNTDRFHALASKPEQKQIRDVGVDYPGRFGWVSAFTGGESEFLKRFTKKRSNVFL